MFVSTLLECIRTIFDINHLLAFPNQVLRWNLEPRNLMVWFFSPHHLGIKRNTLHFNWGVGVLTFFLIHRYNKRQDPIKIAYIISFSTSLHTYLFYFFFYCYYWYKLTDSSEPLGNWRFGGEKPWNTKALLIFCYMCHNSWLYFCIFMSWGFFCQYHQIPLQLKVSRFQKWAELVFKLANKGYIYF